jgi:hypothetical protein
MVFLGCEPAGDREVAASILGWVVSIEFSSRIGLCRKSTGGQIIVTATLSDAIDPVGSDVTCRVSSNVLAGDIGRSRYELVDMSSRDRHSGRTQAGQ